MVTGGAGALGAATVAALLAGEAHCHIPVHADTNTAHLPFHDHPRVQFHRGVELSDEPQVEALYAAAGPIWASIHLAGGFAAKSFVTSTKADLMAQLDTNLVSCALCCRAAIAGMIGRKQPGRIVNVAARPALEPRLGAGMTAYTIAKAGVAALTQALAEEVAKSGVLVNAVAPSIMDTPHNRDAMPKSDHTLWPKVEEVAATILFLASPENIVTRGALVPVYGKS